MVQDHIFRVKHKHTGQVALTTFSFIFSREEQYRRNEAQQDGSDWQLWLEDTDGNSVLVNTQA